MDENTRKTLERLIDLAETFNNQGSTEGRNHVLDIIEETIRRVPISCGCHKEPSVT